MTTSDHRAQSVALPQCAACSTPITFYMHQLFTPGKGMDYYHVECCPQCERKAAS